MRLDKAVTEKSRARVVATLPKPPKARLLPEASHHSGDRHLAAVQSGPGNSILGVQPTDTTLNQSILRPAGPRGNFVQVP